MNHVKIVRRFLFLFVLASILAACSTTPPTSETQAMKFAVYVLNTSENTDSSLAATPWTLERLTGEDVKGAGRAIEGDAMIGERVHTMNVTAAPGDRLTLDVTTDQGPVVVGPFELFGKDGQPLDGEVLSQNGLSVVADPASSSETSLEASSVRVVAFGNIQLSGAAEVPPVATSASGQAAALLINKFAFVIGQFQGLQGDFLPPAHVHRGAVGQNGPVVFELATFADGKGSGLFTGFSRLNREDANLFKNGGLYINVHSSFSKTGEIRGQLSGANPETKKDINLGITNSATFGDHVTDNAGNSLYLFTNDTKGANSSVCNGPCAQTWPALTFDAAKEILKVDQARGMNPALLGSFKREDGSTQITYNGWPLYRFSKDTGPGTTNGQGVGGVWFLVSPDGKGIRDAAAVTFEATLNGANEVPTITTGGMGSVTATLSGTTLTLNGSYMHLSGPATIAHIHGPAAKTATGGVLFPITFTNEGDVGSGKLSATLTLTPEQVTQLKDGLFYVNVHTATNKTGEIRGQLEIK
jgi:predicted lipoprotein with Yx(FWY)xxD motif